jgi:hypothetical protein
MIFIDPSSQKYYQDRLFQDDPVLNRNNCLSLFIELSKSLFEQGIHVHTADYLVNRQLGAKYNVYYSFGMLMHYKKVARRKDVILGSFYIIDSLVITLHLYREVSRLTHYFNKIYVHNTESVGFERFFNSQPTP